MQWIIFGCNKADKNVSQRNPTDPVFTLKIQLRKLQRRKKKFCLQKLLGWYELMHVYESYLFIFQSYFSLHLQLVSSTFVCVPWGNGLRYKAWNPLSAFQIILGLLQNPAEKLGWWNLWNRHGKSLPLVVIARTHYCTHKLVTGRVGLMKGLMGRDTWRSSVVGWNELVS